MDLTTLTRIARMATKKTTERKDRTTLIAALAMAVLVLVAFLIAVLADGCPKPQPPPQPADTHPVDLEIPDPQEGGTP